MNTIDYTEMRQPTDPAERDSLLSTYQSVLVAESGIITAYKKRKRTGEIITSARFARDQIASSAHLASLRIQLRRLGVDGTELPTITTPIEESVSSNSGK